MRKMVRVCLLSLIFVTAQLFTLSLYGYSYAQTELPYEKMDINAFHDYTLETLLYSIENNNQIIPKDNNLFVIYFDQIVLLIPLIDIKDEGKLLFMYYLPDTKKYFFLQIAQGGNYKPEIRIWSSGSKEILVTEDRIVILPTKGANTFRISTITEQNSGIPLDWTLSDVIECVGRILGITYDNTSLMNYISSAVCTATNLISFGLTVGNCLSGNYAMCLLGVTKLVSCGIVECNQTQSESVNWRVDYENNWNKTGTITKPGATQIRVHFSTINVEQGYDNLRTDVGNDWSGNYINQTSGWKSGSAITLTLTSDVSITGYFIIDRIEYEGTSSGAATRSGNLFGMDVCSGVTPTVPTLNTPSTATSGVPYTVTWTSGGTCATKYTIEEATSSSFASGNRYDVTAPNLSKEFSHNVSSQTTYYYRVASVNDTSGRTSNWSNVGYTIVNPGDGIWQSESVNWRVDYGNNWNKSGTITKPGATQIRVHFSTINVEQGYDHLRTDTGNDWSGNYSNQTSNAKSGNSIGLTLTSDASVTRYFIIDRVEWQGTSSGAATRSGTLFQ